MRCFRNSAAWLFVDGDVNVEGFERACMVGTAGKEKRRFCAGDGGTEERVTPAVRTLKNMLTC